MYLFAIHWLHCWSCWHHWVTRPKNSIETDTETFFRDQNFWDRDRDFFSRPKFLRPRPTLSKNWEKSRKREVSRRDVTLWFEHGKSHEYGSALITWVLPCMHGKYDGMAKLIQYDFCHAVWVLWYSMGFVMPLLVWRWESGDLLQGSNSGPVWRFFSAKWGGGTKKNPHKNMSFDPKTQSLFNLFLGSLWSVKSPIWSIFTIINTKTSFLVLKGEFFLGSNRLFVRRGGEVLPNFTHFFRWNDVPQSCWVPFWRKRSAK